MPPGAGGSKVEFDVSDFEVSEQGRHVSSPIPPYPCLSTDYHISGGAGIGGVLEPIGDAPVIIEDDAFVGA